MCKLMLLTPTDAWENLQEKRRRVFVIYVNGLRLRKRTQNMRAIGGVKNRKLKIESNQFQLIRPKMPLSIRLPSEIQFSSFFRYARRID